MRAKILTMTLAAWAASTSCGSSQKPPKSHTPDASDKRFDIDVWIEDDPRMPAELVLDGCGRWKAKNVFCRRVASKIFADIRIYADDGKCVVNDDMDTPDDPKDDKTRTTLAWAYWGGDIKMMMACLTHKDGVYDAHQFAAVMTHEVGHQLGIWNHVPYPPECKDAKTHPSGKKVCGAAVMNPYYDKDVTVVTDIDALAFDVRDMKYSVLIDDDVPHKDHPDCVYRIP
jgi:hypothetical protein